uniref:PHF5-like protein n=1 Tax=Quercus lobata TaxID=97700 RepID=A0A7N2R2H0_QUELO
MAKHHPDLIMCRKQPGIAIGRLCEKCDGKCVICDSYVRPCTLVRVCDECNYGSFQGRCVICGGVGISDAYYCKECTQQEKDRDGCPKIVNLGSAKTDLFYEHLMSSILGAVAVCGLGVSENAESWGRWVMGGGTGNMHGLLGFAA